MDPEHETPVDRVAARVTRPSGERAQPIPLNSPSLEADQAEIARCLVAGFNLPPRESRDWRGFTYGALTVVGYLRSGNSSRWAVRCKCGRYEARTGKTLNRLAAGEVLSEQAVCHVCTRLRNWREGRK